MHKQGNLTLSELLKSNLDFSFLDNLTKEFGENILMEEIREVQTDKGVISLVDEWGIQVPDSTQPYSFYNSPIKESTNIKS